MSHICSVSARGEDGELVAEVVGRSVHEETVLWRELYFVLCSGVSSGVEGTLEDFEG